MIASQARESESRSVIYQNHNRKFLRDDLFIILTAPRFGVNHGNIKVINPKGGTKLEANVTSSDDHSFAPFLCLNCFHEFVSVIDFPQVEYAFRICSSNAEIRQFDDLRDRWVQREIF